MDQKKTEPDFRRNDKILGFLVMTLVGVALFSVMVMTLQWLGNMEAPKKAIVLEKIKVGELDEQQLVDLIKRLASEGRDNDVKQVLDQMDDYYMGASPKQRLERMTEFNRGILLPLKELNERGVSQEVLEQRAAERRKMGVAIGVYRQLTLDDDTLLLVAGRVNSWDREMDRYEPVLRSEELSRRIIDLMKSPSPQQYGQLQRALIEEDAVVLNDLVRHPFIASSKPGRAWTQLKDQPRAVGRLFGGLHLFWTKKQSKNGIGRIDMSYPRELLEDVMQDHGIVTGAKVAAGFIDAHPASKHSTEMSGTLSSAMSDGWSIRWNRMMANGAGFSDDLDWFNVYAEFLGGVSTELEEDEQWIAAKALGSELSMHRARTNWIVWKDDKKSAYFKALRNATRSSEAFRLTVEKLEFWEGFSSLHKREDQKPLELPQGLADFLLTSDGHLPERHGLCADLLRSSNSVSGSRYSTTMQDIINRGTIKLVNDWFSTGKEPGWMQLAYDLRRNIKGEVWNPSRLALGRAMLHALPNITDTGTQSRMRSEGLGLLLVAGGKEDVQRFFNTNKEFANGTQDMVRQLIESGEVELAASMSAEAFSQPHGLPDQYTDGLHRHLADYLKYIEDPLLRYQVSLAMNCAKKVEGSNVPSRLERLMPLAVRFGEVEFKDDDSRWQALALLACEPLAVTSGTAAEALAKWGVSHDFLTGFDRYSGNYNPMRRPYQTLEAAYMGLLLRNGQISELEDRLQQAIAKSKGDSEHRTFFQGVLNVIYEQGLNHLAEGRQDIVAQCMPLSRTLYEKMVEWDSDYTGSAHFWLDLCHAAAGKLNEIGPWVAEMGGRVKKSHEQNLEHYERMGDTPLSMLMAPAGHSLLERWDRPEHAAMRLGLIKAFLHDETFRKMCSKQGGRRVTAMAVGHIYDIKALTWDDLWTAIEEWKQANPELASEVDHLSREVTKMRDSARKRDTQGQTPRK